MRQTLRDFLIRPVGLLLTSALALGACSRASYVFQPAPGYGKPAAGRALAAAGEPVVALAEPEPSSDLPSARPAPARGPWQPLRRARQQPVAARPQAAMAPLPALAVRKIPAAAPLRVRYRTRGIALGLALVLGFFGAHRFYLGYYGAGALYLVGAVVGGTLLAVGSVGLLFGGVVSGTTGYLVVGGAIVLALGIWALFDTVRIITGDLKPKKGEYYPRLFQLRADAAGPQR